MYATHTVFTAIGALAGMIWIDPWLALVAVAALPVVAGATQLFGDRIHRLFEVVQRQLASLSARAQENLAGVRVVRAFAQERAEERAFAERNAEYVAWRAGRAPSSPRSSCSSDSPSRRCSPSAAPTCSPAASAWASWSRSISSSPRWSGR
jgi:ABC-type multidrug transport system fused ATPase/permease subunit